MVVLTTLVGYYLGAGLELDWLQLVHLLVGTALSAAGTLALNQFLERDLDAQMHRTRHRPLPDGRLQPGEAAVFGGFLTGGGIVYLALSVGPGCAAVIAVIAVLYLGLYTPLKRISPLATVLGAIPGALPPVAGWVAARGELGIGAAACLRSCFSGSCRTPLPSRGCTARTTRGRASACSRSSTQRGEAPSARSSPVAWRSTRRVFCRLSWASPAGSTSSGPSSSARCSWWSGQRRRYAPRRRRRGGS